MSRVLSQQERRCIMVRNEEQALAWKQVKWEEKKRKEEERILRAKRKSSAHFVNHIRSENPKKSLRQLLPAIVRHGLPMDVIVTIEWIEREEGNLFADELADLQKAKEELARQQGHRSPMTFQNHT